MNKELIQSRFAKNLASYNDNAKIQKRMAERLLGFLNQSSYRTILEIGCGTGFLTKHLSEKIEFETFETVDIVEECSSYISQIDPQIKFINTDIEEYLKFNDKTYDLIISNASLQWVEDFESIIKTLKQNLNPNGELILSTFGKENFRDIYHVIGTTLNYYSQKELIDMFCDFEIDIDEEIHIMSFATPKDVLKHLQSTGVNAIENIS